MSSSNAAESGGVGGRKRDRNGDSPRGSTSPSSARSSPGGRGRGRGGRGGGGGGLRPRGNANSGHPTTSTTTTAGGPPKLSAVHRGRVGSARDSTASADSSGDHSTATTTTTTANIPTSRSGNGSGTRTQAAARAGVFARLKNSKSGSGSGSGGGGGGSSGPAQHQGRSSPTSPTPLDPERARWAAKCGLVEAEVLRLAAAHAALSADKEAVLDAVEAMLLTHEGTKASIAAALADATAEHRARMAAVVASEDACLALKQRALTEAERLAARAAELQSAQRATQEETVVEREYTEQLEAGLRTVREALATDAARLTALRAEEERMQDASYGLSGEVKDMVVEMEQLRRARRAAEVAAMETEMGRRELYSTCEELKGAIRVYCRVKGSSSSSSKRPEPTSATPTEGETADEEEEGCDGGDDGECEGPRAVSPTPDLSIILASAFDSVSLAASARPSATRSVAVGSSSSSGGGGGGSGSDEPIYTFIDGLKTTATIATTAATGADEEEEDEDEFTVPRSITVHTSRLNARSTGTNRATEAFNFDYVFDHAASQRAVYAQVEPLVNSAIDGYRVCVFAYGQTGSGKTYTMEGSMATEETQGVIPRALETIFARQAQLGKEGWSYTLTCSLVEIYNDAIHDLQQHPSAYNTNGSSDNHSASSSSYHTIQHQGETTTVTNVRTATLTSMADFRRVYSAATQHRRTARTLLNERSSRSHCIFTLNIDGVNTTIRQRSAGVLCLVDLAGSERVNESGARGQQFKEAININKSLLDLGKCIHAMRGGTVAPWRNCKLTYLLQNYLGAKGGKMLMVVNVSDRKQHLPESVNSLRFATRVGETVVGQSVKRVTTF